MKAGGGKAKGSSFERKVAKMVIDAGYHLKLTKQDCYRTPMSGGHAQASKTCPSDLVMSEKILKKFPASVECKHYKKVDLQTIFTTKSKKGLIFKWIKQSIQATEKQNGKIHLEPVVVFRWNNSQTFCIFPSDAFTLENKKAVNTRFFYKNRFWRMTLFSELLATVFKQEYGKSC